MFAQNACHTREKRIYWTEKVLLCFHVSSCWGVARLPLSISTVSCQHCKQPEQNIPVENIEKIHWSATAMSGFNVLLYEMSMARSGKKKKTWCSLEFPGQIEQTFMPPFRTFKLPFQPRNVLCILIGVIFARISHPLCMSSGAFGGQQTRAAGSAHALPQNSELSSSLGRCLSVQGGEREAACRKMYLFTPLSFLLCFRFAQRYMHVEGQQKHPQ